MNYDDLQKVLSSWPVGERRKLFDDLRTEFLIHSLETEFNAPAEVILGAIARAPDITKRGIRGLLAEAAFAIDVIPTVASEGWADIMPPSGGAGNTQPFDALLERDGIKVRIQVKTQRREKGKPWIKHFPSPWGECYVVETQRTRGGTDKKTGKRTRPYHFGEFDVLAVCMWASTGDWTNFRYAIGNDLSPEAKDAEFIGHVQPIPQDPGAKGFWTPSLHEILKLFIDRQKQPIKPS
jgi:hypothetical protein